MQMQRASPSVRRGSCKKKDPNRSGCSGVRRHICKSSKEENNSSENAAASNKKDPYYYKSGATNSSNMAQATPPVTQWTKHKGFSNPNLLSVNRWKSLISSINHFDGFWEQSYSRRFGVGFDDLTPEDTEGDHAYFFLHEILRFAIEVGLKNRTGSRMAGETAKEHYDKLKQCLRHRFPSGYWDSDTMTEQEKRLVNQTSSSIQRDESSVKDQKLPIYRKITDVEESQAVLQLRGQEIGEGARDLLQLCQGLIKKDKFLERLHIMLLWDAIGRPVELKFLNWLEVLYDARYESIDMWWPSIKTITAQIMLFVSDKEHSEMCIYHCFGAFFAVDRGLWRENDGRKTLQYFLFPKLHCYGENYISRLISNPMKEEVPDSWKPFISGRSLRYGVATTITQHPDISEREADQRGNWAAEHSRRDS
jgi:hypothetical protein